MNNINHSGMLQTLKTLCTYEAVLEYLYKVYYAEFDNHSSVTSSHWKTVGSQEVIYKNRKLHLNGVGFGAILPNSVFSRLKNIPETFLCLNLLKEHKCSSFLQAKGKLVSSEREALVTFNCVRQILSLQWILSGLLSEDVPDSSPFQKAGIKVACVIGDGYGYMTSLLKVVDPELKVISVNLGRTLLFDVFYSQRNFTAPKVGLITCEENKREMLDGNTLLFMEAEKYELLKKLPIDLFINIASLQEMNNKIIENYFKYIRASSSSKKYFYCCNRFEKILPDGEITRFREYPWKDEDVILFDELCPWYQKYPASTPPFWRPFDGPIQHRLVEMR